MIRKLRLKIVGISVVTVAAVLICALVVLTLSTRSQMSQGSEARLYAALEGKLDRSELPGSSGLPCFVAEVYSGGTLRLSGSSYYNLENQELVTEIVQTALEQDSDSGVLKDYSLRYLRRVGALSVRIAFTDCSVEQATVRSLLLRSVLIALAALVILTGLSYWLAGFAVRPVRRAWQEQKQFISDASHELKTPLTSISGFAELMSQGLVPPDKVREFSRDIQKECARLTNLVEDIIDLSRLEEGGGDMEWKDVELYGLCDEVMQSLESIAKKQEITLQMQGQAQTVHGVEQVLHEMVYNLCDNAIKYNHPGGRVTITVGRQEQGVYVSVADTGIGIPPDHQSRVFERFYRVDKSHSRAIGGTGLGLSIVKHAAALHSAQIDLQSQPEQGTTITVTFPGE